MTQQLRMTFSRTKTSGRACLEYSWVPEGLRRNIILEDGQDEATSNDQVADDLDPSHVQVYVTNNEIPVASLEGWQFLSGPPKSHPIERAEVRLDLDAMEAKGTIWFIGGTSGTDRKALDDVRRDCPTGL